MGKLALKRNEIFVTLTRTINDLRYEVIFLGYNMNDKIVQKPLHNNLKATYTDVPFALITPLWTRAPKLGW